MEDLPLGRFAALVPEFAVKDLPFGGFIFSLGIRMLLLINVVNCVFQCQPTALLRASDSTKGG